MAHMGRSRPRVIGSYPKKGIVHEGVSQSKAQEGVHLLAVPSERRYCRAEGGRFAAQPSESEACVRVCCQLWLSAAGSAHVFPDVP